MAARLASLLLIILGFGTSCLFQNTVEPFTKLGQEEFGAEITYENGFTGRGQKDSSTHFDESPRPEDKKAHNNILMLFICGFIYIFIFLSAVCILVWLINELIQLVRANYKEDVEKTNSEEMHKVLVERIANMKHLPEDKKEIEKEVNSEVMDKVLMDTLANMKRLAEEIEEVVKEVESEEKRKLLMEAISHFVKAIQNFKPVDFS